MDDVDRRLVVDLPFDRAVAQAVKALTREDFSVIRAIDVRETMRDRLHADFRQYVLLTALHPALALRGLRADLDLGAHLLCVLAVYELPDGETVVAAADPMATMFGSRLWRDERPELAGVAVEMGDRMARVLEEIGHTARVTAA